jgi:hypothetical protein
LAMASKISREMMILMLGDSFFIRSFPFHFDSTKETWNKKPLD